MNFDELGEDWNELKQRIFDKLEEDYEKHLKLYLNNIIYDIEKAMKYKHIMNMAHNTIRQLQSLRDDELKRRVFEDEE